ncbi:sensor histidine kinase [Nocardiopsis chromatogenes]|uniref:sensor histidine kinase n=1 Tax=Nocardiopsis chromatogenes TaxID=280239 RepID=UPI000349C37C|nr:histidine kinase [Nocardiopsis chromatogenes]
MTSIAGTPAERIGAGTRSPYDLRSTYRGSVRAGMVAVIRGIRSALAGRGGLLGAVHGDRALLGGRLYIGSVLWALVHLSLGVLLWALGAYFHRDGAVPGVLLATVAAMSALMLLRRTAPGAALAAGTAVLVVDAAFGPSSGVYLAYGDLLYAACVWGRRRSALGALTGTAVGGAAVLAVGAWAYAAGSLIGGALGLLQVVGLYVMVFAMPVVTGWSVREHRGRADLERERAEERVRMAELDRARAVAEERTRVARELHDVIANHMSAVAVQSTAALSRTTPDPDLTRRVLEVVRDNSVQGLEEMRRMIGVLRAGERPAEERVTPRVDEADLLVRTAREAGMRVEVREHGEPRPLAPQVDAAAYRILQESLTNAQRYAAPRRVEIGLAYPPDGRAGTLVVTVENPLPDGGAAEPDPMGAGMGLVGMRERAVLLGGGFTAGPSADGRVWRVRAELPCALLEPSGGSAQGAASDGAEAHGGTEAGR